MNSRDHRYFELLKKKIVVTMQQSYPGINPSISDWKGQGIVDFQEDLLIKVNAHISEKWFYSHMKLANPALPRIDVLNLLSKYVGFANWDDFIFKNRIQETIPAQPPVKANRYFIIVPLLLVITMSIFYGVFKLFNVREYQFCFYDADTKEPIKNNPVEVLLFPESESPVSYTCNSDGCFILKTDKSSVRMVVKTPYYKTDTIVRILKKLNRDERISLHTNDYALMIHYFSQMNVQDWEKRRSSLNDMIDDGAMIYQVYNDKKDLGMELYNKSEFIDKLTMPSGTLRNIEILDTKYKGDKLIILRFRVKKVQ